MSVARAVPTGRRAVLLVRFSQDYILGYLRFVPTGRKSRHEQDAVWRIGATPLETMFTIRVLVFRLIFAYLPL